MDERYLRMARIWAENSYCARRQVGALVVKDKMIISDGYNGTPSGFENVCEDDNNVTKPYVLHAEANAITKLARSNNNSDGATIYITASPCIECAKLIIQSGIKRVVYGEKYRLTDGIDNKPGNNKTRRHGKGRRRHRHQRPAESTREVYRSGRRHGGPAALRPPGVRRFAV